MRRFSSRLALLLASCIFPAAALAAPPLSEYVGKYSSGKVKDVAFLQHPAVLAGVKKAIPSGRVRDRVLDHHATQAPIARSGGKLVAHACEPHNCGDHQWSILIDPASGATDVCYYNGATARDHKARWYLSSGKVELRDTAGCPSE